MGFSNEMFIDLIFLREQGSINDLEFTKRVEQLICENPKWALTDIEPHGNAIDYLMPGQILNQLADAWLEKALYSDAFKAYQKLGRKEKIKEIAILTRRSDWEYTHLQAVVELKDRRRLASLLQSGKTYMDPAFRAYLGERNFKKLKSDQKRWLSEKGYSPVWFEDYKGFNMGYMLSASYDVAVGIAKGGLFLSYYTQLFGLDTRIIETHGHDSNKRPRLKIIDSIDDIAGKNVLVLDKDVVSGRTTKYIAQILRERGAKSLELALVHDPGRQIGTRIENIPREYSNAYMPSSFSYYNLPRAINQVRRRLKSK